MKTSSTIRERLRPAAAVIGLLTLALVAAGCGREEGDAPAADPSALWTPPADLGYITGLDDAPVTVVEFSDFGCPYCAQFATLSYPDVHAEFVLSGRVRWVFVPFVLGRFPNGDRAAHAAECAGSQDRFWAMHHLLYDRQPEWRRQGSADDVFETLAREAGLDAERFRACYAGDESGPRIERSNRLAREAGVRATPTFVINGRMVEGALPPAHFRTLLEWAVMSVE